jgi:hypothetical protein
MQYPNVSIEQKRAFWLDIVDIFHGLTLDFTQSSLNETTVRTLIDRNHRAVFYVTDYEEMTGYTPDTTMTGHKHKGMGTDTNIPPTTPTTPTPIYALDACLIDNQLGNPEGPDAVSYQRSMYADANDRKATDKAGQRLYLVSMAGGMEYEYASWLKFGKFGKLPVDNAEVIAKCAGSYNIPGMDWCPETLLDGSQITNYYAQVAMDEVIEQMLGGTFTSGLPHAIYINAIGSAMGTIRTGAQVLWGKNRSPNVDAVQYAEQGYCYVDSFVLYNVLNICNMNDRTDRTGSDPTDPNDPTETGAGTSANQRFRSADCDKATDLLVRRRAKNPLVLWEDAAYGRLATW